MKYLLPDGTVTTTPTDNCPISIDGGLSFAYFRQTGDFTPTADYSANFIGNVTIFSTDNGGNWWTRDGGANWGQL